MAHKRSSRKTKNAVIIPVFNESRTIGRMIRDILQLGIADLIVVNDGSYDNTAKILHAFSDEIKIITLPVNSGKGAALRAGTDLAYSEGYQNFVFIDGDRQHDPADIGKMIRALADSDLVINHRLLNFQTSFISKSGRFVIRSLFNLLYGTSISDHISGFRAVARSAYPKLRWHSDDYRVEIEMISRAVINGVKYCEVATPCAKRRYKGMGWRSGASILIFIVRSAIFWRHLKFSGITRPGDKY